MNDVSRSMRWPAFEPRVRFVLACAVVLPCLLGCSRSEERPDPAVIRIGVLPDEDPERLLLRRLPLIDYLSTQLQIQCELSTAASYTDLLQRFCANEVDLAFFGGLTFLKAHHTDGAVPLVMRDVDRNFSSYFLVRSDSAARELADCRGMTLSFGDRLSTSGHLMPRHFIQEQGMTPETFFAEVGYSGAHDATAFRVRDGIVDVGVANASVIDQLYTEGILNRGEVRVLWETPPYVDYVWAVQKDIKPSLRRRIRNAFLSLSSANRTHSVVLDRERAGSFLPATTADFRDLTQIAVELGLLDHKN